MSNFKRMGEFEMETMLDEEENSVSPKNSANEEYIGERMLLGLQSQSFVQINTYTYLFFLEGDTQLYNFVK